ncbi:IS5 family transposase, partial [Paracoccus sp. MC1854]|uniref:IS5 family transposase n=1 Tax=Paracoccus sp. MC1854 TaxID=2760306 RepID=UPI00160405BB
MTRPEPTRYRTTNWKSYNDGLKQRGSLLIWLDQDMVWRAPKAGRPGRPPVFSDAAIQFCLMVKVLFGLPLRQTTGMVASILQMARLDWSVPDFSTLSRRQKTISVDISSRRAAGPLNLLVDSTGIKFLGDGEWLARKHGTHRRRQYRKVHLAMDTATGDIRAVEFTSSREGDSPVLPDLLDQIPPDEQIGTVTGDGAFDTRRCHAAILERGGTAVIPIRKNGRRWKEDCPAARARNDTLRTTQRFGRAIWKRWSGYHVRSRIEARMRCLKSFGERIASRDPDRQTAEIHVRIALMNRFNALGTA